MMRYPYTGPIDSWRRFMSGMTTTWEMFMCDESEWTVKPLTQWDDQRLREILK